MLVGVVEANEQEVVPALSFVGQLVPVDQPLMPPLPRELSELLAAGGFDELVGRLNPRVLDNPVAFTEKDGKVASAWTRRGFLEGALDALAKAEYAQARGLSEQADWYRGLAVDVVTAVVAGDFGWILGQIGDGFDAPQVIAVEVGYDGMNFRPGSPQYWPTPRDARPAISTVPRCPSRAARRRERRGGARRARRTGAARPGDGPSRSSDDDPEPDAVTGSAA